MRQNAETEIEERMEGAAAPSLPDRVEPGETPPRQLFALMAGASTQPELAQEACTELYRRYATRLLFAARKWEFLGAKFDADLLVSETLLRAYRHAKDFNCGPQPDPETEDGKVLVWLFRILKNLIMDFCRIQESNAKDAREGMDTIARPAKGLLERIRQLDLRRYYLHDFMITLSPDESTLLLTSYKYYNYATERCEIPPEERQTLCSRLNISEENLRVRRLRLVARLKGYVQSRENKRFANI